MADSVPSWLRTAPSTAGISGVYPWARPARCRHRNSHSPAAPGSPPQRGASQLPEGVGRPLAGVIGKPGQAGGAPQYFARRHACGAKLPDAGIAARLAELLSRWLDDQRVMQEARWLGTAQQPRKAELPAGGIEEVFAPDYQV